MFKCPVCRREFDERFQVFAASSREPYDSIDCARRAATAAVAAATLTDDLVSPMLLPTLEVVALSRRPAPASTIPRRRLAAALAVPFIASPASVAAGLSLVVVGTATSLALWSGTLEPSDVVVTAAAPQTGEAPQQGSPRAGTSPATPADSGLGRTASERPLEPAVVSRLDGRRAATPGQVANSDAPSSPARAPIAPSGNESGGSTELPGASSSSGQPIEPGEAPVSETPGRPATPSPSGDEPSPPPPPASGDHPGPASPPPAPPPPPVSPAPRQPAQPQPPPNPEPVPQPVPLAQPQPQPAPPPPPRKEKQKEKKDKEKNGAIPAIPADGKERRDEPKPRSSPPATPAVRAVPASVQDGSATGEGGGAGSPGASGQGSSQGSSVEERGNGNGQGDGGGSGNGNGKKP